MKNFKDKVVVITGAGSGIGRALAQAFAQEGARLALNDANAETLQETVELLKASGADVLQLAFDVSQRKRMYAFAAEVVNRYGRVDVMINNAGLALGDYAFHEVDLDHFERIMAVNFYGVLYGSRAFIPYLLRQPEAALVNVSSVFGLSGIIGESPYCTSKFAVRGLNETLIQEYRGSSLRVHSVHPGGIKTNIIRNAIDYEPQHEPFNVHLRHSPDYAARTILRGIRKKRKRILIGSEAYLIDRLVRFFPSLGPRLINWRIERTRGEGS